MQPTQSSPTTAIEKQAIPLSERELKKLPPKPDEKQLTLGQKVADAMAAKVGSWAFLIGQTTVLAGWVGANMMPGVPHWDESPFILLNLVFSFASAYTAPVVLMSQNRQSEAEREEANYNHQVNLKTAHDLELLHEKMDKLHELRTVKLEEIVKIVKDQHGNEIKITVAPVPAPATANNQAVNMTEPSVLLPAVFAPLPTNENAQGERVNDSVKATTANPNQFFSTNLLINAYIDKHEQKA